MRYLFFLILLGVLISCEKPKQDEPSKVLKVENYVDSVSLNFPNYKKNGVLADEMNNIIEKDLPVQINNKLFNDIPFKLMRVEKCGEKYILNLSYRFDKYYGSNFDNKVDFDLYAISDKETAKSLTEEDYYYANVKFIEFINYRNSKKYCVYSLMSPFVGYNEGIGIPNFEFGAIGVKLIDIISRQDSLMK